MTDLDRLLELARKASEGPWRTGLDKLDYMVGQPRRKGARSTWIAECFYGAEDAEYIAAASPDTIIELIERVKQLERQLDDCNGALRGAEGR